MYEHRLLLTLSFLGSLFVQAPAGTMLCVRFSVLLLFGAGGTYGIPLWLQVRLLTLLLGARCSVPSFRIRLFSMVWVLGMV